MGLLWVVHQFMGYWLNVLKARSQSTYIIASLPSSHIHDGTENSTPTMVENLITIDGI